MLRAGSQNPNMTQVSLKLTKHMATRVMAWAGEHPRIHSTFDSGWCRRGSPQLYQLQAEPCLWHGVM